MLSEVADETISSRLINGLVPRKRVRRSLQWVFRFQWGRNPPFSPQAAGKDLSLGHQPFFWKCL